MNGRKSPAKSKEAATLFTICAVNYMDHASALADSLAEVGAGKLYCFVLDTGVFGEAFRPSLIFDRPEYAASSNLEVINTRLLGVPFYDLFDSWPQVWGPQQSLGRGRDAA